MMKVLYVVSCFNNFQGKSGNSGRGGHYNSLETIANAMSSRIDVSMVAVGNIMPAGLTYPDVSFLRFRDTSDENGFVELIRLIQQLNPDVIHTFDVRSHEIIKKISFKFNVPHVITKPGGGPSRYSYPYCRDITVFTGEDLSWFRKHPYFKKSRIHLIPNRVETENVNDLRLEQLRPYLKKDATIFMTISRITEKKRTQLEQSIRLIKRLEEAGECVQLIVIGVIMDDNLSQELSRNASSSCLFFHEDPFTTKSHVYLPLADVVIAMGRGVMEACSYGRLVMSSSGNYLYPFFYNEDNFNKSFYANFTERSGVVCDDGKTLDLAMSVLRDKSIYDEFRAFIVGKYHIYFDVNKSISNYIEVYRSAEVNKCFLLERMLQVGFAFALKLKTKLMDVL